MNPVQLLDYTSIFRTLSRLIDVGVLIVTPERELEFISDRAKQLFLHDPDIDKSSCWSAIADVVTPALEQAVNENDEQPGRMTVELRSSGPPQRLELELHTIRDEARARAGYLILVKDHGISQRVEQSLRLAMQMNHTGRLYAELAHDLRQPVGAILIHLKVLEELNGRQKPHETLQGQYQESMEVIRREVKELDASFQLFLNELTPSDGEATIALVDLIENVVQLVEPQIEKKGLTLHTELDDIELRVVGHEFHIKQAILNLVANATEAMETGTVSLRLSEREDYCCIEVADEGPGIPAEVQHRMFDCHYTTKEEGMGLGLHLVQQTAQSHGGEVHVYSTPGTGATFELLLPRAFGESAV